MCPFDRVEFRWSATAMGVDAPTGAVEVAAGVEKKIAEFAQGYPDIQFQEIDSSVAATRGSSPIRSEISPRG